MTTAAQESGDRLLTVVISVYNLEHYIRDCLESVLQQRFSEDIAVIVVNDGSTDSTAAQIEATLRDHPGHHVRVISQDNAGVSATRNRGIDETRSRYLAFLDGDDMWAPDFFEQIMPVLLAGRADIVEFNIDVVSDAGHPVDTVTLVPVDATGSRNVDTAALSEFVETYQAFVWARVYRSTLWHDVRFPLGRHYEDNAILPQLYLRASSLHRLEHRLYRYRRRGGSITHVATLNTVRDLAMNAAEALARCGTAQGEYWLSLFHKMFLHTCSQAARVDAAVFPAALQIVGALAKQHQDFLTQHSDAAPRRALGNFAWGVHLDRSVFLVKRTVKRILGREMKPRARLAIASVHDRAPPSH
ncbi:glycosyltransferase [Burkholderia sp. L27(2015)]|uniref:glycosyltransferase family 2 protein n=1 Tax=Burkholderia sp. L27(2015) TaxID=1641858 RepID=UPI00131D39BC|nr:glycosyltransferase [Burkholderia sp. L27(2015)]